MSDKLKNYIKKWKNLINVERECEIKYHRDEIRRLGKKREAVGRAVLNLKGKILGEEFGKIIVRFHRDKEFKNLDMKVGDVVLVSKGDPLKSNLLGDIIRIGKNYIDVSFENIPPKWALKEVRIDLYTNDITFKRMEEALKKLKKLKDNKLIKIIIGLDKPTKIRKIEDLDFFDEKLNFSQKEAVRLAVSSEDLFLIHGPPGTGKTRTLTEIILQEFKKGKRILVCADSNNAVDNILNNLSKTEFKDHIIRIGHPSRTREDLIEFSLFYKIIIHEKYPKLDKLKGEIFELIKQRDNYLKPTPSLRRGLTNNQIKKFAKLKKNIRGISAKHLKSMAKWIELSEKIKEVYNKIESIEKEIIKKLLKKHRIVLATNSMAGSDLLKEEKFDVCIIDEGSQSMEPSCLIPIIKSNKLIMAGDHKQLPPTVLSNLPELKKTLFERLIEEFPDFSSILRVQYRMNEIIMNFPNKMFYNGLLIAHESVKNINIYDLVDSKKIKEKNYLDNTPIIFVDVDGHEKKDKESFSYYNVEEAEKVKFFSDLLKKYNIPHAIITPYDAQVKYLNNLIEDIEINSVDGFQGREEEVIIVSFVRTKELGFLKDIRRLNVAITRPKRKLILIGNRKNLEKNKIYKELIEYIKKFGKILIF